MKDNLQSSQQPKVIRVSSLFNLLDYNIKINDVCWNQVKMTSSKWISCFHRIYQPRNNNSHNGHICSSSSSSPFNTFSGRRHHHRYSNNHNNSYYNWYSPIQQQQHQQKQHNSFKSYVSLNQSNDNNNNNCDIDNEWNFPNDDNQNNQSSLTSSSSSSSLRSIPFPVTPIRPLPPHHLKTKLSPSKFNDLPPSSSSSSSMLRNQYKNYHYGMNQSIYRSKDDTILLENDNIHVRSPHQQPMIQSVITLINPFEYLLINCETNLDTNSAQINPEYDIIAVSNQYWLAFYSIRDNDCYGTIQFPNKCIYWTWISSDSVAIITEDDVYHWSSNLDNFNMKSNNHHQQQMPQQIFSLNEDFKNYQIVNYMIDPSRGFWSAVTALYIDDGEICGKVQIHSQLYGQSQCIDAHVATFVCYHFDDNYDNHDSLLLVLCKRDTINSWKLYIIELNETINNPIDDYNNVLLSTNYKQTYYRNRPMKCHHLTLHNFHHHHQPPPPPPTKKSNDECIEIMHMQLNNNQTPLSSLSSTSSSSSSSSSTSSAASKNSLKNQLLSQKHHNHHHQQQQQINDIPTHIVCDNTIGLIFIISKYGSIYICDLETGLPLYYDLLKNHDETESNKNNSSNNNNNNKDNHENLTIFSISYDQKNSCILAICRNGRVLVIKILFKKLLDLIATNCKKLPSHVRNRLNQRINNRKLLRLSSTPNTRTMTTNNIDDNVHDFKQQQQIKKKSNQNNSKNNSKIRTVCISTNPNENQIDLDDDIDNNDDQQSSSSSPTPSPSNTSTPSPMTSFYIDQDDLVEEITRL